MSTLANKDTTTLDPATVRADFSAARRSGLRAKDAAASLGLSEGAVVAAHVGAHDLPLKAVRLQGPWVDVLQALEACGTVMALTRNESTVHEKDGVYRNVSVNGHVGLALDPLINLRLCFPQLSPLARRRIILRHCQHLVQSILEYGVVWWASPARLRRLIRAGAPAWNIQRQGLVDGMRTLRQDAVEKMLAGLTSLDEVRSVADL